MPPDLTRELVTDLRAWYEDQAEKAPVAKALPPGADTPVLIQKILDVTNLDDLLAMLNNKAHTALQQSLIYQEVKKRRNLVANRFQ